MLDRLPPLTSLRAFDAAARHLSFRKAAEELHVTPAALSYQIRLIEDDLGVLLFRRLNRAVKLTEEGHLLAPGVREGFERLAQAVARLRRRAAGKVLTISAGPAFTAKWLTPRLYRFMARFPGIDARVSASLRLADLAQDDIDIAVRFGAGDYAGCRSEKLLDEYVTPMCSPAIARTLKTPADLARHTLIHDETPVGVFTMPDWKRWLAAAGAVGVDPDRSGLHFNVADHALDAASAGAGVVLGRAVLASSDLRSGRLVAPFPLKLKVDYAFYVVVLEERIDEPPIAAVRDWLFEEAAGDVDATLPGPPV